MSDKSISKSAKLSNAFVRDVVEIGSDILASGTKLQVDDVHQIAYDLAEAIIDHWGGSVLYIPKTNPTKRHERNTAILNDFTGSNHHQLARKYGLSTITIYQILANSKETRPKTQKDLFDDE